ncbi:MAG: hypothetical protein MPW15_20455 [Candidatus Manganitrophus sp.]|nr:hypothetical protein [Candidatus Manganitrophus sp.]
MAEDKKIDDSGKHRVIAEPSQVEDGERMLIAGIKLYHDGKIEDANKTLTEAVELLPLSPIAHNNLGMVLRHQGKRLERP